MVKIKRCTDGDSRVAKKVPTFTEFRSANEYHVDEVRALMLEVSNVIRNIGEEHDWSKTIEPWESIFYRDLCNTIEGKIEFMDGEWAKFHYESERHHLKRSVPENVNLFDVIEMICDCVAAGLARSGEFRPLEIDESILQTALKNTVDKVRSMCTVED